MKLSHCLSTGLCLLLFSCNKTSNQQDEMLIRSVKTIQFQSLKADSLMLNPPAFSGSGFFKILGDSIYFLDSQYSALSVFNSEGKFCKKYLGEGEGPGETKRVNKLLTLTDGRHFVLSDFTYSLYSPAWQRLATGQIDWEHKNADENEILNNPNPELLAMYGFNWMSATSPCLAARSNNRIIFPISCEHPKMNAFEHEEYYKSARILAELDVNTGKIDTIFGTRSPQYLQRRFIPNFDFYQFTVASGDSLIVSFAADSLLFVYDNKNKLAKKFGVSGRDMKTDYHATQGNFEEVESHFQEEMKKYGHYDFLWHDQKNKLTFRSYKKGESKLSGLQVYNGQYNLIADVDTPWDFQVIGYIAPYYYASGIINEEKEILGIYRFALK